VAEFLTTHGIAYHIEGVIRECKQRLILISPYIQLSDQLYQRLVEADRRGVRTIVVHGKERLRPEVLRKLDDLANERVFYCENLHAKCYCNEDSLVISSMNLYEFSEKNNREMGIIIRRETDLELFRSAMKEVQSIVTSSVPEQTVESEAIARGRRTKQDHVATKPTLKQVLLDALITVFDKEKADAYVLLPIKSSRN
jgi:phosphatidylserine/phosphatidylglycerophosphate/cardiolipin synthase-like enzyme